MWMVLIHRAGECPRFLQAQSMIIDHCLGCRISASVMFLGWWMDAWGVQWSFKRSSKGTKYYCCITHQPSIEWNCRWYQHMLHVKSLVVLALKLDIAVDGSLEILYHITSMTFTVMYHTQVVFYPRSQFANKGILQRKAYCASQITYSQLDVIVQRCHETLLFVTTS